MPESKYQIAIKNAYLTGKNNIAVNAVAGSGKTTTLLMLLEIAKGTSLFMAFNKSIVDELKDRVPKSDFIDIATAHSIGCQAVFAHFKGKMKVVPNKTWDMLSKINDTKWKFQKKKFVKIAYTLSQMYDIYRMTLSQDIEELKMNCDIIGIDFDKNHIPLFEELVGWMNTYNKAPIDIDFTDMIYLAVINPVSLPQPDNLFIDECQDLNKAQHLMIDKMRGRGRFIAVGDERQAIYLFAGADSVSFNKFAEKENTIQLPLSVCYRCGTEIVKYAQRYNPVVEPYENNHKGAVKLNDSIRSIKEGDMVICRNLKPLVEVFLNLIDDHKRAFIRGKDLGKGLTNILKEFLPYTSVNILPVQFRQNKILLQEKLRKEGIDEPLNHPRYRNMVEKFSIITRISFKFSIVGEVIEFIEKIFSDNTQKDSVTLSTIHKAKGLEADNVFILDRNLIPSKYANTKEQLQQECNLFYVAITRAKYNLSFISSGVQEDEDEEDKIENRRENLQWR
jgi:hypothetical protein